MPLIMPGTQLGSMREFNEKKNPERWFSALVVHWKHVGHLKNIILWFLPPEILM